ncbi:replication-relaxation family protein [Bacillus sp. UNCCL81]|uniref:replication-relaxation family protein n=1 Tax=Bacillus sp. UNCCL81 TaxID=1502755 RepID=UPI00256FC39F|nr:replication-relaxation family protein [Bacillus sp. UNCCL81]
MKRLDYLTTSQIQILHNLKSERNAQRVLKQMSDYVNVVKQGQYIYFLNAKGRGIVDCKKVRKSTGNFLHFVMRNALYIAYGMPTSWKNEIKISSKGATKKDTVVNIADALFKYQDTYHIVEVDNEQSMANNRKKIDKYNQLINRKAFGEYPPVMIWITTTELRRKQLTDLCTKYGITSQVFTANDFI